MMNGPGYALVDGASERRRNCGCCRLSPLNQVRLLYIVCAVLLSVVIWSKEPILVYICLGIIAVVVAVLAIRWCLIIRWRRRLSRLQRLEAAASAHLALFDIMEFDALSASPPGSQQSLALRLAMTSRDFNGDDYELLSRLDNSSSQRRGLSQQRIEEFPLFIVQKEAPALASPPASAPVAGVASAVTIAAPPASGAGDSSLPPAAETGADAGGTGAGAGVGQQSVTLTIGDAASTPTAAQPPAEKQPVDIGAIDRCAICLEDAKKGEVWRTLPCLHSFHADACIDPWLRRKASCPICKFDLARTA